MFLLRCGLVVVSRRLSTTSYASAAAASTVDKAKLKELRKLSGYSFVLCKKALKQHDYDVQRANEWLHAQAAAEGWAKMEKLGARATPHGLVCVASGQRAAAMVEVNCETDFVARTELFTQLARQVATSCLPLAQQLQHENCVVPLPLDASVQDATGRPLPELVAESVGRLGEKIELGRAVMARASSTAQLSTYVHPSQEEGSVQSGRYGALVVFELFERGRHVLPLRMFGRNLCQHVVGMAPQSMGDYVVSEQQHTEVDVEDQPVTNEKAEEVQHGAEEAVEGDEDDDDEFVVPVRKIETRLLDQDFLVDPDYTVRQYLSMHNAKIIEFVRIECGNPSS